MQVSTRIEFIKNSTRLADVNVTNMTPVVPRRGDKVLLAGVEFVVMQVTWEYNTGLSTNVVRVALA
jgi:hypothetical protein